MLNRPRWTFFLPALLLAVVLVLAAGDNQILVASASEDSTRPIIKLDAAQSEPGMSDDDVTIGRSVRAEDVLGFKVRNLEGDNIGRVEDIVVTMDEGQILFVTMNYSGRLFQSDKIYPVPAGAFSWDADREELQLDLDEDALQDAPGFDRGWPDLTDPEFDQEIYDYWLGIFPELPTPAETDLSELIGAVAKVSDMIGLEVNNLNEESLGEIDDIIVNVDLEQLSSVVLSFKNLLGLIGTDQYVAPLSAFELDLSGVDRNNPLGTPLLDLSPSNLMNAPTFSSFVDLTDPNWSEPYQGWWQRMASNAEQTVTPLTLAGTAWELESFGEPEDNLPVLPGTRLTLNFGVERYVGTGGCNWFLGVYTALADHSLRLQTPAQSRTGCEPVGIMEQEGTYMSSLLNIAEYQLEADRLLGYAVHNQRLLTFVRAEEIPFEATTWLLQFYRSGTRWRSDLIGTEITALFEGDQLSGSAGCNSYQATVERDGDRLTISNLTTTELTCAEPEGIMTQEEQFLEVLQTVSSLNQIGGVLQMATADGQEAMVFGVDSSEMLPAGAAPADELPQSEAALVWVDDVQIEVNDSGELEATIVGNYPDSCSTLGEVETVVEGNDITVTMYAQKPPDVMCTQALVPFEETVTLDIGDAEPGDYTVTINDSVTTSVTIP
jgi:heat shock protein HslJ/sporulation protein YlmC with PRC-barrel domain